VAHFLTVRFPGKHRNEYGDPAAFFKVNDPTAGQTLLTLFRQDYGAALSKGPGLLFDLVDAAGLTPAQAVRFEASVRQVKETWEGAYSVTDGPQFSGNLDRLYDRADKWQDAADAVEPTSDAGQAGVGRRIAHWLYNSLKGACGLIIEKAAKGIFDSATKRP
jgi:hypothetical protein